MTGSERGFSVVELVLSMVVLLLLVSITIAWYQGPAQDARVSVARVEASQIAGMIAARQLQTRAAYSAPSLPSNYHGNGLDPWGGRWRIDPSSRAVVSAGPDGVFGSDGSADDVVVRWDSWQQPSQVELPAPAASVAAGGFVRLEWPAATGLRELVLVRTGPEGARRIALATGAVEYSDGALAPRVSYAYRLEAEDIAGRSLIGSATGVFIPGASPPTLRVTVEPGASRPGQVRLRVTASSLGAELAGLTVGTRELPLRGADCTTAVELDRPASGRVNVAVTDRAGLRSTAEVTVGR
ncbi:MAG: hypothetical protein HY303_19850 [Candidatus Wallbacteria bacterium]|nr:hypothetical protein [Candidatus Wallbacteria bacterium]